MSEPLDPTLSDTSDADASDITTADLTTGTPEQVKRRLELRGFTREQAQSMQRAAAQLAHQQRQMAQQQVQRAMVATNNFISTVVALISGAVSFAAALAWNAAIQDELNVLKITNKLIYALSVTAFAIIVIAILGFVSNRIFKEGKNMIPNSPIS